MRTVPGTVPGAVSRGVLTGVGGWVFSAILWVICSAMCGPFRKEICGRVLAAIAKPTHESIRIATPKPICGAICEGTCGPFPTAICAAIRGIPCDHGCEYREVTSVG